MFFSVGDKIRFKYPTKSGIRTQCGKVLPCYLEDPNSGSIGTTRTKQYSQGTGKPNEKFVRIKVHWGRGYASFNLPKIVGNIEIVERI